MSQIVSISTVAGLETFSAFDVFVAAVKESLLEMGLKDPFFELTDTSGFS